MATFTTEDKNENQPLIIVRGGQCDGEIIYLQREENMRKATTIKKEPILELEIKDGKFEQLPSDDIRVLYIAGASGSGKSTYAAMYISKYRKLYPNSPFFIFSRLNDDKVLDKLKPKRIVIDEGLIHDPIELEEVTENSIVLFDDIDTISNKKVKDSVNNTKMQILEMGRHMNIKIIVTSHLINKGNETKTIMNEMQSLTVFPQAGGVAQIKYVLKQYFGLSTTQINRVVKMKTRWVTITKTYPQVIFSEHEAIFASEL